MKLTPAVTNPLVPRPASTNPPTRSLPTLRAIGFTWYAKSVFNVDLPAVAFLANAVSECLERFTHAAAEPYNSTSLRLK